MACTHHTWDEIDRQWDVPRLVAWNKYSAQFPPLHALVAKYLGYKPPEPETKAMTTEEHAARLLSQLGFNA